MESRPTPRRPARLGPPTRAAAVGLALGLGLAAVPRADAAGEPKALLALDVPETCEGASQNREMLAQCLRLVTGACYEHRSETGDAIFAGCMAELAIDWEAEVSRRQLILKPTGHAEGKSGRAARWLATRSMICRDPNQLAQITAEAGQDTATAAVAQCELTASIQRVDQLGMLIGALAEPAATTE